MMVGGMVLRRWFFRLSVSVTVLELECERNGLGLDALSQMLSR
jgi:hypothetical protein